MDRYFGNMEGFQAFGSAHLIPVIFYTILTCIWIFLAKKWDYQRQYKSALYFSFVLAGLVLFWMLFKMWNNQFDPAEDFPFHLCNILTLVLPFALYYKSRWFFGILYFWVLVGTMQAILTPELKEPFPHFIYFRYWTVHCGLVMLIFYGLLVFKWKVYWKDIRNAIIGANVYVIFSFIANYLSGGNYFFTMHKPRTASLLDYLGPWPWYLFTGQIIMVLLFIGAYPPLHFNYRKYQKTNQTI